MKHLKEGLIKQRGITQFYKEIQNPTYMDICKPGNVVILEDKGKMTPLIVLSKFMHVNMNKPIMVQYENKINKYNNTIIKFSFWETDHFNTLFPEHNFWKDTTIKYVFKTGINPNSVKTIEDLKRVLEPFEIYCEQ